MPSAQVSVSEQFKLVTPAVRPIVLAARKLIRDIAPSAQEITSQSKPPRAKTYMWKIVRYAVDGEDVVGIGTFTKHSALIFYRGRELDDGTGLLEGSGRDSRFITLREPADLAQPAVKRIVQKAFKLAR